MKLLNNKILVIYLTLLTYHIIDASSILDTLYTTIDIEPWFNNQGFGSAGNFDEVGNYFNAELNTSQLLIRYNTSSSNNKNDNIKCDDQMIPIGNLRVGALYMLVSASRGPMTRSVHVRYTDDTEDFTVLSLPDWQDSDVNQMDRYEVVSFPLNIDNKMGSLFCIPIFINPAKVPSYLILPKGSSGYETMHVFGVTAYESSNAMISSIESSDEWLSETDQVFLVKVHNTSPVWIQNVYVRLGNHVETVKKGFVEAIAPGHVQSVQVIVRNVQSVQANVLVTLVYVEDGIQVTKKTSAFLELKLLPDIYQPTTTSVQKHRPPSWLKQAKFGIFIHWGLFSVPSWAPVGKVYAEWYWWRMNHKEDEAFLYHRETYGENFEYDDFLKLWQPRLFDPYAWLDLINKSGAKYFVFTTKHHDGIALFDTNVTDRSSVHLLEQGRDFVQELLSVSEAKYPHLKRGLYFSLPEWYHPKYKDDSLGWKGPPINPYTGKIVPYTGSKDIESFVNELQVPQLQELINTYNPDILWCDIGGINNSTVWQSKYFNKALKDGKQVTVNDRCGYGSASDFTTIEYKAVTDAPSRFWEATRGIGPYSFGYNRETKVEDYASTIELIQNLVDAVSKGGNFLLNIGPESSGNIPKIMSTRLLEIGEWMNLVYPSIFESVPYWINSNEEYLRFTSNMNGKSIYIFSFKQDKKSSNNNIIIRTPIPIQKGTRILLMNNPKVKVDWKYDDKGSILLVLDYWEIYNIPWIPVFEISMPRFI